MSRKHTTSNPRGAIAQSGRTLQITQAEPVIQRLMGNHWFCRIEDRRHKDSVSVSFKHDCEHLEDLLEWIGDHWPSFKINALHCAEDIVQDDLKTIKDTLRPVFMKHRRARSKGKADPLGIRAGLKRSAREQRSQRQ